MEYVSAGKFLWFLSTDFGRLVFIMFFLTWGLIIVDLVLMTLLLVRKLFGRNKLKSTQ